MSMNKAAWESAPRDKKLDKLANYSSCQVDSVKCNGFKRSTTNTNKTNDAPAPLTTNSAQISQYCKTCMHSRTEHTRQYDGWDDLRLNQTLRCVCDIEQLFALLCREQDVDAKHVYFFLFKLLRKRVLNIRVQQPHETSLSSLSSVAVSDVSSIQSHVGVPPFEHVTITRALISFLFCRYGGSHSQNNSHHQDEVVLTQMFEAVRLLIYLLNVWRFETPAQFKTRLESQNNNQNKSESQSSSFVVSKKLSLDEQLKLCALYKLAYIRWMCYSYVPSFCDSLLQPSPHQTNLPNNKEQQSKNQPHFDTCGMFGVSFLRLVFSRVIRPELNDKFIQPILTSINHHNNYNNNLEQQQVKRMLTSSLPKLLAALDTELEATSNDHLDESDQIWAQSDTQSFADTYLLQRGRGAASGLESDFVYESDVFSMLKGDPVTTPPVYMTILIANNNKKEEKGNGGGLLSLTTAGAKNTGDEQFTTILQQKVKKEELEEEREQEEKVTRRRVQEITEKRKLEKATAWERASKKLATEASSGGPAATFKAAEGDAGDSLIRQLIAQVEVESAGQQIREAALLFNAHASRDESARNEQKKRSYLISRHR